MFEQAERFLQDFHGWGLTLSLVLIALMLAYIFRLKDPSHLERAMARKREKEIVSDAVNRALHDAFVAERLSADAYIRWGNKLGRDYDLPDLVAVKAQLNGKAQNGLKVRILQRLSKTGIDVQTKLANMRSRKPKKPKLVIPKLPG